MTPAPVEPHGPRALQRPAALRRIYRLGLVLLPTLFAEGALGVYSASLASAPGSELFDAHVALGTAVILLAGWAFGVAVRSASATAQVCSAVVLFASLSVAVVAVVSLTRPFGLAGLLERSLAILALGGAAGLVLGGYRSASGGARGEHISGPAGAP